MERLRSLDIFVSGVSETDRKLYDSLTTLDVKARWWCSVVLCAKEWQCGGTEATVEQYCNIVHSLPSELEHSQLARAVLYAFKVE